MADKKSDTLFVRTDRAGWVPLGVWGLGLGVHEIGQKGGTK